MADVSGRTDLAVGDVAEDGAYIVTLEAAAAITKGQVVYYSAAGKVSPTTAAGQNVAGVALKTVSSGQMVPVLKRGLVKCTAAGAISVGAPVGGAAGGKVAAIAYASTYSNADALARLAEYVGKNEGGAATADGDLVLIRVNCI